MKSIIVIGGGASGLVAAITAAQSARNAALDVDITVLEQSHRVGRSILTAGNGRCNFYNTHFSSGAYYNPQFVQEVFDEAYSAWQSSWGETSKLKVSSTKSLVEVLFENLGLCWRETTDGWCYPVSDKATSVLEVLLATAATLPITLRCDCQATSVEATGPGKWHVTLESGEIIHSDVVVIACGGRGLSDIQFPEELEQVTQYPILGALGVQEARDIRDLDGFRIKCDIALTRPVGNGEGRRGRCDGGPYGDSGVGELIAAEKGEVLFRKYGVSGIAIFNLSRFALPGDKLVVDFYPTVAKDELEAFLTRRLSVLRSSRSPVTWSSFLAGMIANPLAEHLIEVMGMSGNDAFTKGDVGKLASVLKTYQLTVSDIHDPKQCQVMRGGFQVTDWNPQTLQHYGLPGLFAAGEALDIDGPCGGYNLSWAWLSGLIAGNGAALSLCSQGYREQFPAYAWAFPEDR